MKAVLALLLLACLVSAQPDIGANQYPIQADGQPPLKEPLILASQDLSEAERDLLRKTSLIVGVISSPSNFEQRAAVRSTWAQSLSLTDVGMTDLSPVDKQRIVVRFVIGRVPDESLDAKIKAEATKYGDILRLEVDEGYFQLTQKTGEFMKWAFANVNFDWLFKCDDDSFVRLDKLLEDLEKRGTNKLYMGKMWTGTPVDRRVDSYTISDNYDTFAAGAGYALSNDLVQYIVEAYDGLHKWPMEDVAVGMWLGPLDIHIVDHPNFHSMPEGCDKDMIVQNPADPALMKRTFFNTMNGVPCNEKPDPFDSSRKNIPDHVFLQLGIPKPAEKRDVMQSMGAQMLVQDEMASPSDELEDGSTRVTGDTSFADLMNRKPDPNSVM